MASEEIRGRQEGGCRNNPPGQKGDVGATEQASGGKSEKGDGKAGTGTLLTRVEG